MKALPLRPPRVRGLGRLIKNRLWQAVSRGTFYGLATWEFDESWVDVERRTMVLPGLGPSLEGLKVVHLSDIHCSPIMRQRHISQYFEMVNALEPDIIVLTGDFVTASFRYYARSIGKLLRTLSPRIAALACLGNHDYGVWHPSQKINDELSEYVAEQLAMAGIEPLVNASHTFIRSGAAVHFVGLGDLWCQYDPDQAFGSLPDHDGPVIALVHNPDAAESLARMGAQYILSGHTHGKPTDSHPFNNVLFPSDSVHYYSGHYDLPSGSSLYINRGIGGFRRSRREHQPEITLFTLTGSGSAD